MMKKLAITVAVSATFGMGAAQADNLQIDALNANTLVFSLQLNGATTQREAGIYNITNTDTGKSFVSFCVELLQTVQAATLPPFTLEDGSVVYGGLNFTSVNIGGYTTTPTAASAEIQALFDQRYGSLDTSSFVETAAFQIAIWELADDGDLTTGDAQGWSGNAAALALAGDWITNLGDPDPGTDTYDLTAWSNPTSQDMLQVALNGGGGGTVPEPGSLLLGLAGLAGLGFARRKR